MNNEVVIYTDGSYFPPVGKKRKSAGAWAATLNYNGLSKTIKGIETDTSIKRMELTACVKSIELAEKIIVRKDIPITIYSDSRYVVDGINGNIKQWIDNGWRYWRENKEVELKDKLLWLSLLSMKNEFSSLSFVWVKGHSLNLENNAVDSVANKTLKRFYL